MKLAIVDMPEGEDLREDRTYLSVAEFAAQPEVDVKYVSQIYGWMKKGLPWELRDGKKVIPWDEGSRWVRANRRRSGRGGSKAKIEIVDGIPERDTYRPVINEGDWLRWDRGNNLGPAYALVVRMLDGLVKLAVEYRVTPVYFERSVLERDIAKGVVKIVHVTEVTAFLIEELARFDFLAHLAAGPERAQAVRAALYETGVVDPDMLDRWGAGLGRKRPSHYWPADDSLLLIGKGEERDHKNH